MRITSEQLRHLITEELSGFMLESQMGATTQEMMKAVEEIGFNNIQFISSGQYGSVFKGAWHHYDGVERAVKVIANGAYAQKEGRIYRKISDARKGSALIAKHFPRVDMVRKTHDGKHVLIVMEILENDPNVRQTIGDIFGHSEVDVYRPDLALKADLGINKDIGKRANALVMNKESRSEALKKILYGLPKWEFKIRTNMMAMNLSMNTPYPTTEFQRTLYKIPVGYEVANTISVINEDLASSGDIARTFLAHLLNMIVEMWEQDPLFATEGYAGLFDHLQYSLEDFIQMYRSWTPVGISPVGSNPAYFGAPQASRGLTYPGAESLLDAIEELKAKTGIDAYDMHDQNVLVRPGTKDIVIVDVGLFKETSRMQVSPDKEVTAINERCQKGYKTHPTRKTKKMFGRTYRNCVKAKVKRRKRKRKNEEKLPPKVFAKAKTIEKEGKPKDQALAIAASMYEKGDLKEADPKKGTGKKPKGSGRRLYTDEDPTDTVSVSFKSVSAIQKTLAKSSFKSKSHKRQSQIINLIHQRARAAYQNAKDPEVKARLKKAYEYAKKRKEASKKKTIRLRKQKKKK